jgi:hypothetical protein
MKKPPRLAAVLLCLLTTYSGVRLALAVDYSSYQPTYLKQHLEQTLNNFIARVQADVAFLMATTTAMDTQMANWISTVKALTLIEVQPTYSDDHTFILAGDFTSLLTVGKGIVADCGSDGLRTNTVATATYAASNTTVTVNTHNLTANLVAVYYYATRNGLNAYGSGDVVASAYGSPSWANLQSAVAVANASGRRLLLTSGTWPIAGILTITAPMTVSPGAVLSRQAGSAHLVIKGLFTGAPGCFSDNSTNHDWVVFGTGAVPEACPAWWGATGDGMTDDTLPLLSALRACQNTSIWLNLQGLSYLISANLVNTESVQVKNGVLIAKNTLSGWLWTSTTTAPKMLGGSKYRDLNFTRQRGAGALGGFLRIVDEVGTELTHVDFNGDANCTEAIRLENDTYWCERALLNQVRVKNTVTGLRLLPASEMGVADRYRPVTARGTDSFDECSFTDVHVSCLNSGSGFLLNGDLARVVFKSCGGWWSGNNTAIFETKTIGGSPVFISPWGDFGGSGFTGCGLFKFNHPVVNGTIINPELGGALFDIGRAPNYAPVSPYFLGTLISDDSGVFGVTTVKGAHAQGKSFSYNDDDFYTLESNKYTVTGAVAVDTATYPSALAFSLNSSTAGITNKGKSWRANTCGNSHYSLEAVVLPPDTKSTYFYVGSRKDSNQNTLANTRDATLITNENAAHNGVSNHLYLVIMGDAIGVETARVDLGAYSAGSWLRLKLLQSRNDNIAYAYVNDVLAGSATLVSWPMHTHVLAANSGTSTFYLDRLIQSANR